MLLLFFFSPISVISSSTSNNLSNHCSSLFPEQPRHRLVRLDDVSQLNSTSQFNYFIGNSGLLRLSAVHETDVQGLFSVDTSFGLFTTAKTDFRRKNPHSDSMYGFVNRSSTSRHYSFELHGLWSKSNGLFCVVGVESNGIPVSLKLYNFYNFTNFKSLVIGNLESLVGSDDQNDLNYFDPISIVLFSSLNYEYTIASQELVHDYSSNGLSPGLPFESLFTTSLCSLIPYMYWGLRYESHCKSSTTRSSQKCSPLGDFLGELPNYLMLQEIDCSDSKKGLRFLIKFGVSTFEMWSDTILDPKAALIGEGVWDSKKNRLFVVACRFLNATTESWAKARVSDCSIRLSLTFPAVWTIGNTRTTVGRVWSTKKEMESGYFEEIGFQDSQYIFQGFSGVKYEYTMIEKAKKWCPRKEPDMGKYPQALSQDMASFDIFSSRITSGYARPISVHSRPYETWMISKNTSDWKNSQTNMSYQIVLFNVSREPFIGLDVTAEGIYDVTTGSLCMVGCRNMESYGSELSSKYGTLDCEIAINFQFPPRNSRENEGLIKGRIESKRKKSDPLYFRSLNLSSAAFVSTKAREYAWLADLEIVLGLVSNTLACAFTVFQIFHLRKNPDSRAFVSRTMLSTLTFGYAIALVRDLNRTGFEIIDMLLMTGGWFDTKQVTKGVTGLILFLLQARIIQLTWSSRSSHANQNTLRIAETDALVVCLPLYFGGFFLYAFLAWSQKNHDLSTLSPSLIITYYPLWNSLNAFSELLLDWFLVPQVLLNLFMDSREKSLSLSFYAGTTSLRVWEHACSLYKAQFFPFDLAWIARNVLISFGSLLLAVVIYLQQKFGGRCIVPLSLGESMSQGL